MAKFTTSELLMNRAKFDELSIELQTNLLTLQGRLNVFFEHYGAPIIVSSGYRSAQANAAAKGSTNSWHLKCAAADLHDKDLKVWQYVVRNLELASQLGLWFEDKRWTPTWVHAQIYPPGSGLRIYKPSSAPAAAPQLWSGSYDARWNSKAIK